MIISKKRFEEEVQKRVEEAVKKVDENRWRFEREQRQGQFLEQLQKRIIALEKACGIDHTSHHPCDNMTAGW